MGYGQVGPQQHGRKAEEETSDAILTAAGARTRTLALPQNEAGSRSIAIIGFGPAAVDLASDLAPNCFEVHIITVEAARSYLALPLANLSGHGIVVPHNDDTRFLLANPSDAPCVYDVGGTLQCSAGRLFYRGTEPKYRELIFGAGSKRFDSGAPYIYQELRRDRASAQTRDDARRGHRHCLYGICLLSTIPSGRRGPLSGSTTCYSRPLEIRGAPAPPELLHDRLYGARRPHARSQQAQVRLNAGVVAGRVRILQGQPLNREIKKCRVWSAKILV
ncbi:hypothetical protein F5B18DRAFT_652202 [Nemania serpens]|nr:hypothetical protein F5B18DRAFT_652202 [Nemania serpens]